MIRLRIQKFTLDSTDVQIIEALVDDSRTSVAKLARLVGLSAPSVADRIKRLEENGVIKSYTAEIDPAVLGRPLSTWIRIRPVPGNLQRVAKIIREIPEIVECDRITGDDCYIARAYLRSVDDIEKLTDKLNQFAMTNTSIIQSSPVKKRLPLIMDE